MKKELKYLEKVLEIYTVAARREQAAYDFYIAAAKKVTSDSEKKIFLDLAEFEMQHLKLMEKHCERTLERMKDVQRQGQ